MPSPASIVLREIKANMKPRADLVRVLIYMQLRDHADYFTVPQITEEVIRRFSPRADLSDAPTPAVRAFVKYNLEAMTNDTSVSQNDRVFRSPVRYGQPGYGFRVGPIRHQPRFTKDKYRELFHELPMEDLIEMATDALSVYDERATQRLGQSPAGLRTTIDRLRNIRARTTLALFRRARSLVSTVRG